MNRRVLIVDNDPDFLEIRAEQLEAEEYQVFKATSSEQAEQILDKTWLHLAVIDLRLKDETDDKDISGLTLAKKEAYRSVSKIILTKYPTYQYVREALGPALDGLPPAVEFLAKQEGPEAMMRAVEEAFEKYVGIDWDLTIQRGEQLSFSYIARLIEPGEDRTRIPDQAGELEDLFRRLFYGSGEISLNCLLAQREGMIFLSVFAYPEDGRTKQFVVVCGAKQLLLNENIYYEKFVPKTASQGGIVKNNSEHTVRFAANTYTLIGGNLEEMTTFSRFYRRNSLENVSGALDYLFENTLAAWYGKDRFLTKDRPLNELCRECLGWTPENISKVRLEHQMESVCQKALSAGLAQITYSPSKLIFQPTNESYPNPVASLFEQPIVFNAPVLCGTTHGQLNGDSILADRQGRTWLIDFSQISRGPLFCDFVSLETAIRFDLLTTANVQARYKMEQQLMALAGLNEVVDTEGLEPDVRKALGAINRIRQRASDIIGQNMNAYRAYHIGLLLYTVNKLAKYDPELRYTEGQLLPYLHSLLSAAMLCQKLIPQPQIALPPEALHSLWVDEPNKEVWVEGRNVKLAPGEYDLLLALYHRSNQLCTRQYISQAVYNTDYGRETEDAVNTTMARLRKKIENDSKRPKYIVTVRGEGYRLETGYKPASD